MATTNDVADQMLKYGTQAFAREKETRVGKWFLQYALNWFKGTLPTGQVAMEEEVNEVLSESAQHAQRNVTRVHGEFEDFRCRHCWKSHRLCICKALPKAPDSKKGPWSVMDLSVDSTVSLLLLTHCKEYGRTSSTNILLQKYFGAETVVWGTTHGMQRLADTLAPAIATVAQDDVKRAKGRDPLIAANGSTRCFVIFPVPNAVYLHGPEDSEPNAPQLQQLIDMIRPAMVNAMQADGQKLPTPSQVSAEQSSAINYRLILLDGTWREAGRMERHIPKVIPRLSFDATAAPAKFKIRKQRNLKKTSTYEAFLHLLCHIFAAGEPRSVGHQQKILQEDQTEQEIDEDVRRYCNHAVLYRLFPSYPFFVDCLETGLELHVDAGSMQGGRPPHYDWTFDVIRAMPHYWMLENMPEMHDPEIVRPTACPKCNADGTTQAGIFRNEGFRSDGIRRWKCKLCEAFFIQPSGK
eukprot:Clim_evm24s4 gene=Clim_evmTU24s4